MIGRIEVHSYCCVPKLAIDLDRYHAFNGAKSVGKGTLVDVPVVVADMLLRQSPYLFESLYQLGGCHEVPCSTSTSESSLA